MSGIQWLRIVPIVALASLGFIRAGVYVFYLYSGLKRKDRNIWLVLAFLWGVWSLPFWHMLYKGNLEDIESDFKRFKLIGWVFDRRHFLNTIGVYFGAQVLSFLCVFPIIIPLIMLVYGTLSLELVMKPWVIFLVIVYLNATVLFLIYLWGYRTGRFDLETIGLRRRGALKWAVFGLVVGAGLLALAAGGEFLAGSYLPTEGPDFLNPEQATFTMDSFGGYVLLMIGAGLVAPIGEEVFFRGYMFRMISTRESPYFAILVTSLVFAAWHLNIILFPVILVAALVINFIRYKTGSLIPCIIIHMMNNLLAVSLLYWSS